MSKESLSMSTPKLILAVVLIVGIGVVITGERKCLKEGEIILGAVPHKGATECCRNLESIQYSRNGNCEPMPGSPAGVCSKCGNGTCEEWEAKCSCPEDCE